MNFLAELKRRKVLRTAGLYIFGAWLALQAAEVLVGLDVLSDAVGRPLLLVLLTGFPVAVLLSWFIRFDGSGFSRDDEESADPSVRPFLIAGLAVVLAVPVWWIASERPNSNARSDVAIAVLPFATIGPDNTEEYFADGISEQLIGMLARLPGISVTSRTSAFSFKNTTQRTSEIAESLNVAYVLSGSVQHDQSNMRVRVELVDAAADVPLWSDTYNLSSQSVFSAQDKITESVAEALQTHFSPTPVRAQVTNVDTHRLYLQGMHAHRLGSVSGFEKAIELCREGLDIDAAYAPAWECIAGAYTNLANRTAKPQYYELAESAARKALELDPNSFAAYQTIGYINNYHHGDILESAAAYRRAVRLSPGGTGGRSGFALLLASVGEFKQAVALSEEAAHRDPLSPITQANLAAVYAWAKRWKDSLQRYEIVQSLAPEYFSLQYRIGECLLALNRSQEALAAMQKETHEIYRLVGLALVHHTLGNNVAAQEARQELQNEHAEIAAYNIAYVLAFQGEKDAAFEYLEKELELSGTGVFSEILGDYWFENLYTDPRWQKFLHKVGRAEDQLSGLNAAEEKSLRRTRA